jgi:hypothetical protein
MQVGEQDVLRGETLDLDGQGLLALTLRSTVKEAKAASASGIIAGWLSDRPAQS